ncbi:MAG: ferrous iron transport protein A [Clostridiales bacterium]|nr:ferrous iron transport protein A [Clostridiales bacterium]
MPGNACLNDIHPGQYGFVVSLLTEGNMRRRLLDIGLTPGTRVDCLGRSPLGDPTAFLIRDAVIALRAKDCENVLIQNEPLKGSNCYGTDKKCSDNKYFG